MVTPKPVSHVAAAKARRYVTRLAGLCLLVAAVPTAAVDVAYAQRFASEVVRSADAAGMPFAVIDKPSATLWVFEPGGRLLAESPVLVGQSPGDVAPADIGTRPLRQVRRSEKITGAGRYETEAGVNSHGEDIVWLDYDAALSMHRVRHVPGEHRPRRLQTPTAADNRISFGCVNMPPDFYEQYVDPMFRQSTGVVYVLPEQAPISDYFPFARSQP